jgi:hypothetical protein
MSCTQGDMMTDNVDPNVDVNSNPDDDKSKGDPTNSAPKTDPVDKTLVDKVVEERVNESLKDIKAKLDIAFKTRDDALKEIEAFKKKERDAEVKRLKEEGKEREAYELQLAEQKARADALEKQNTELTRDVEVRGLLSNLSFRNDKAIEMAYREVIGQLVRDETGKWVHRSGIPIKEFIKHFAESDDNAFLFKTKTSTGGGSAGPVSKSESSGGKRSLFKMSQEEVIKAAIEGKL